MPRTRRSSASKAAEKQPKTRSTTSSKADNSTARPTTGSPRWLPWEDRFLAQEVYKHRPFAAGHGKEGVAWEVLAEELRKDSEKQGPRSTISRTGEACRARMKLLIAAHRVCLDYFY